VAVRGEEGGVSSVEGRGRNKKQLAEKSEQEVPVFRFQVPKIVFRFQCSGFRADT
jgi:hypothetical protein